MTKSVSGEVESCSVVVHHFGFSSRRPGFESRREHFDYFYSNGVLFLLFFTQRDTEKKIHLPLPPSRIGAVDPLQITLQRQCNHLGNPIHMACYGPY